MLDLLVTGLGVDVVQKAVSDTNKAFPFDDNRLLIDKVVWDKQDAFVIRFDDKTATKLDVMEGVRDHVTGELVKQRGVKVQVANLAIGRRIKELSILALGVTKAAVDKVIRACKAEGVEGVFDVVNKEAGAGDGDAKEGEEDGFGSLYWVTDDVTLDGKSGCVIRPGVAFEGLGASKQCRLLGVFEATTEVLTERLEGLGKPGFKMDTSAYVM